MIDVFHDFERRVVLELDSALNKWIDNIPAHCTPSSTALHR